MHQFLSKGNNENIKKKTAAFFRCHRPTSFYKNEKLVTVIELHELIMQLTVSSNEKDEANMLHPGLHQDLCIVDYEEK